MAKLYSVLAVFCVIHFATGRVVREAPAASEPSTLPSLSDLTKQAEEALSGFHTKFLEFVGVKTDEELVQVVQERTKTYADKLQELLGQVGEEAKTHAGKAEENFTQLRRTLEETVQDLRTKNPELTSNVENLETKFQDALRNVVSNTEGLTNRLKAEGEQLLPDVENVLKQILDNTREAATKVLTDLQTPQQQQ